MRATHDARPIAVTMPDGGVVHPVDYDRVLRGSVVHLKMSLSKIQWRADHRRHDTFLGKIERIHVLFPPKPRKLQYLTLKRLESREAVDAEEGRYQVKLRRL